MNTICAKCSGAFRNASVQPSVMACNRFASRVLPLILLIPLLLPRPALAQYTTLSLPPGYVQVQGDIITDETNAARLLAQMRSIPGMRPEFTYAPSTLWPNRVVPFAFQHSGIRSLEFT